MDVRNVTQVAENDTVIACARTNPLAAKYENQKLTEKMKNSTDD